MCGIAGILTPRPDTGEIHTPLARMLAALRHRGPDDAGTFRSAAGHAALAHARLSILDLSPAGHQPMSTPDGRLTIVFNGEIYNFQELRQPLVERGVVFRSNSDTEVILRAYEAYGAACVEKLRGMFAFALWDEREKTCLLARDPFGIKPLYYCEANGRLTFASEVRALLAAGEARPELDPLGVYGYFRTGSVPEPRTLLRDVRCLEAGSLAVWNADRLETRRFWELRFEPQPVAEPVAVARTRTALLDSVEHHFISDVPVGVFLSGGIDSTALVALARVTGRKELHTFSISFPDSPADEGGLARRTAEHFGTRHEEWRLEAAVGRDLFGEFLHAMDQPSIDGLNTFTVSKFAHQRGLKVVLSGLGGDELFGGYKSFRDVPRLARWNRRLRWSGPARRAAGRMIERAAGRPQFRRLGDLLGQPARLDTAYTALRGIYTRAEAGALTRKYTGTAPDVDELPETAGPADPTEEDTVSRLELGRYMRNQLLRDSDVMSMAHGLELRVPFLDRAVTDALVQIPAAQRLQAGKRFLLQAVPEVPEWIVNQPKRGFLFPFEQWLGGEWRETFARVEADSPVPTQTWYRKWCIFVLEHWLDRR
ncbi:MAG: asparagine synthase glutamine-hydrolyzing [Limisphaerales bacterium]|nr:MAG: asparagine synthase glutamine-hydrolyzing [Limisphaerales bacterium]